MEEKLNIIKNIHKDNINNFKYIDNIEELLINDYIWYFKKKNLIKKTGIIKQIIDNNILELYNQQKNKIWYIYTEQHIIFKREKKNDKFKNLLQTLLDTDFQELTNLKKNKNIIEKTITYKHPCTIKIEKIQ
jgi:hypothetical protein